MANISGKYRVRSFHSSNTNRTSKSEEKRRKAKEAGADYWRSAAKLQGKRVAYQRHRNDTDHYDVGDLSEELNKLQAYAKKVDQKRVAWRKLVDPSPNKQLRNARKKYESSKKAYEHKLSSYHQAVDRYHDRLEQGKKVSAKAPKRLAKSYRIVQSLEEKMEAAKETYTELRASTHLRFDGAVEQRTIAEVDRESLTERYEEALDIDDPAERLRSLRALEDDVAWHGDILNDAFVHAAQVHQALERHLEALDPLLQDYLIPEAEQELEAATARLKSAYRMSVNWDETIRDLRKAIDDAAEEVAETAAW